MDRNAWIWSSSHPFNSIELIKMRILITGATGFVGSVLIPELLKIYNPRNLSAFVLPGEDIPQSWKEKKINIIRGNITDRNSVHNACRGHSLVIHLAGLISYWKKDRKDLEAINVKGVANMVDACIQNQVKKLIHISSVGAVGYKKNKICADESTPFNWPAQFLYMHTKYQGQRIIEKAIKEKKLRAIILNPASIMGPGDPHIHSPHNQLYNLIYKGRLFGSFSGGLAIVDVRDLADVIIKSLQKKKLGEKYLIAGANLSYQNIIKTIGKYAHKTVFPFQIPSLLLMVGGFILESFDWLLSKKPLLTFTYGRLSGWHTYYSNEKSKREFSHTYIDYEKTIRDTCTYFEKKFLAD